MKKSLTPAVLTLFVLAALLLLPGCSRPPGELISAVDQDFAQLETAQAALYAPQQTEAARSALAEARAEVEAQDGKFALRRSYKQATALYQEAQVEAQAARDAAAQARDEAELAANETLEMVRDEIALASSLLQQIAACPRRAKDIATDTAAIESQLAGFAAGLSEVELSIVEGDFLGARDAAESLSQQVITIETDLRTAGERLGCAAPAATT